MEDNYQNINIFDSEEDIGNILNSENEDSSEENSENIMDDENIHHYKKENYKIKDIINQLKKLNILRNSVNCPKCNALMNLTDNINYKDGCIWRCVKKGNVKHDIKINIRYNSIFENVIKTDNPLLYFILLENYILNIPIITVYRNCKEFSKDISIEPVSRNCLGKIYYIIRNKFMQNIHKKWELNPMGQEHCIYGKSKIEIDELKFITYNNSA